MRYLARGLEKFGYLTLSPTLPAWRGDVALCAERLGAFLKKRLAENTDPVHFVGHSMGGLIIRHCLAARTATDFSRIGRIVLIGTPNGGAAQSNLLLDRLPFLGRLSPALADLAEPGMKIAPLPGDPPPDIGIIAGTKQGLLRSKLFPKLFCVAKGENDGLVSVESARLTGASDEILLPFDHLHIHWRPETTCLVEHFLRTGRFASPKQAGVNSV